MMKTIPLTHGKVAIVDGLGHEWLSQWKWYFHPTTHDPDKVYAARTVNFKENGVYRRYRIFIHRQLLGVLDKLKTDHINNDGLDNRRANIRPATQTQNARNIKKRPSRGGINPSQYINP